MAGSCPVNLAVAVADAGGMGAMGALMSSPDAMVEWAANFRSRSPGPFQLNLWIAEPSAPARDFAAEQRVREFLSRLGAGSPVSPKRSGPVARNKQPSPTETGCRILRSSATL